jgi:hypothetical protein
MQTPHDGKNIAMPSSTKPSPRLQSIDALRGTVMILMTLDPALLVLAYFDRRRFNPANPLILFGRVPLFYFVVHFYIIHAVTSVMALLRYGHRAYPILFNPVPSMGGLQSIPTRLRLSTLDGLSHLDRRSRSSLSAMPPLREAQVRKLRLGAKLSLKALLAPSI